MCRRLIAAAVMIVGLHGGALAQSWPYKPVQVIIPSPPGSPTDIIARVISNQLNRQLGQAFVVQNQPGGQWLATITKAESDGHTLLMHNSSILTLPVVAVGGFDPFRDVAAISPVVRTPLVLVVSPSKYKSLRELADTAKAKPKSVSYASTGNNSPSYFAAERFRRSAGFEASHIPFRASSEAIAAVVSGQVDFFYAPISEVLMGPLLRDQKLRALAVSSPKRSPFLRDVPTTLEEGYKDSDHEVWIGAFAPAKTPDAVLKRISEELAKAVQSPAAREQINPFGADPLPMTPIDFTQFLRTEREKLNLSYIGDPRPGQPEVDTPPPPRQ